MSIGAVAKRAGVSVTTVCRVLKGFPSVQPKTAQQVRKAIRELGYRPVRAQIQTPAAPDSIDQLKGQDFAIVCFGNEKRLLKSAEVQAVIRGMREVAGELGIELVSRKADALGKSCRGGLLFVETGSPEAQISSLPAHLPFVRVLFAELSRVRMDNVSSDPAIVGKMAWDFLASQNCTTFAFVTDAPEMPAMPHWARAFAESARRAQKQARVFLLGADRQIAKGFPGNAKALKSIAALRDEFDSTTDRLGVFAPTALMAAKVSTAQLSDSAVLVTCEGDPASLQQLDPSIACIDLQWPVAGRMAVQQLVHRILHPTAPAVRVKIAPVWRRL